MDRTWADGRICRTRTGWLFFESSSRSIFLFEHDLRANASRLSRGKTGTHFSGSCSRRSFRANRSFNATYRAIRNMIPFYIVRHLAGELEELSCFRQLEDESAAMYFNIVHGAKVRRRFTTQESGEQCADYVLIARAPGTDGFIEARKSSLYTASHTQLQP